MRREADEVSLAPRVGSLCRLQGHAGLVEVVQLAHLQEEGLFRAQREVLLVFAVSSPSLSAALRRSAVASRSLPLLRGLSDIWVPGSQLLPCVEPLPPVGPFPPGRLTADLLTTLFTLLSPHEGSFVARVCKVPQRVFVSRHNKSLTRPRSASLLHSDLRY